jgi:hypothetical protein
MSDVLRRLPVGVRAPLGQLRVRARSSFLQGPLGGSIAGPAKRTILHCFGDSHATIFLTIARSRLLRHTWIDVVPVSGATALGMVNPRSRTAALPTFSKVIARLPAHRPLLFLMGEVDCGFLIWLRAERLGLSVQEQLEESVANYTSFLGDLVGGGRRVVVASVPLPTIRDSEVMGEVAEARQAVTATLEERTALTLKYDAALREWAAANGCSFLDYGAACLDPVTGVVREELRNPDPTDHHLAPRPFAAIVVEHLRAAGIS